VATPFAVWAKSSAGHEPKDLCDPCYYDHKKDPPVWEGTGIVFRDAFGNVYFNGSLDKSGKDKNCSADLVNFPIAFGMTHDEFTALKPGDLIGYCFNEKTAGIEFKCNGESIGRAVGVVDVGMNWIPDLDAFRVHIKMMELQEILIDQSGCALEYCCPSP